MVAAKFDPQLFFQRADNVALLVSASEIFSLLNRSLDLPAQWAALVRRETGDQAVISAGGVVKDDDLEDILFVRVTPVEVALREEAITSHDRFRCSVQARLRISLVAERGELISFLDHVVGSHRVVQVAGLGKYLEPAVRTAIARVAADRDAARLVDGHCADELSTAVSQALEPLLFSAGMILEAAPIVRFESKTVREVQATQQKAARRKAEHDAARQVQLARERAQSDHLDHVAKLLTRLESMAAASPDVELPELIRTFSEKERGELYDAMFETECAGSTTQWIVVAAGDELLFFDPTNIETTYRRLSVAGGAGPVRSIQSVDGADGLPVLLLGAAKGVYRWPIDRTEADLTFVATDAPDVQGGFNSVTAVGDRVFASHSELGLCEWCVDAPTKPRMRFESMTQDAKAVRGVCTFNGELYCAIDDRVIRWPIDDTEDRPSRVYAGSMTTLTAICPTADGLFAGTGEGDVLLWPNDRDTRPDRIHTGTQRAAESIWYVSTGGVKRLIYTDTSLHVHARVLGDNYACRYEAGGQTLRRIEIAPDLLVATNDLRDRLICWTPGRPAQPSGVIGVSRLTGRSVQDVCLVRKI